MISYFLKKILAGDINSLNLLVIFCELLVTGIAKSFNIDYFNKKTLVDVSNTTCDVS